MTRSLRSNEAVIADDLVVVLERLAWEVVRDYAPGRAAAATPEPVAMAQAVIGPAALAGSGQGVR